MRSIRAALAVVLGTLLVTIGLAQSPASAAGWTVTATPRTWHFTYEYKQQTGTTTVPAQYDGTWTATDTAAGTSGACSPAPATMSGSWTSTTDFSTYHFNSVSAAGVQRRTCAFTTVGPNAANSACVPSDCQIKVVFSLASVTPAHDEPVYEWQARTTAEHTYEEIATDIANDCGQTDWFRNCSAPIETDHPDQAKTTLRSDCPQTTNDMLYDCSDPMSTLAISTKSGKVHLTTTAKVLAEKVVIQKRRGTKWATKASKAFAARRIAWTKALPRGRYRVVFTPGGQGGRIVDTFRIR